MIPDQIQASQLSLCLPLDDEMLAFFEADLASSNLKQQTAQSSVFSSPFSCPPINTADLPSPTKNDDLSLKGNASFKRTFFTKEEDRLLTFAAIKYRQESWNIIAKCVPGKTPKQCRDRWTNYLHPSLNFEPWKEQEDQLLVSLVNKHGTHWTKMKKYFPDRSTNSMKNRWYWLIKNQVKVIPAEKIINNSPNCIGNNQIYGQGNLNQSSNIIFQNNNFVAFNSNSNMINNNHNLNSCQNNVQQEENNSQKYYYILKNKGKGKNLKRKSKTQINVNNNIEINEENDARSIFVQIDTNINNKTNSTKSNEDDLISFDLDELNW